MGDSRVKEEKLMSSLSEALVTENVLTHNILIRRNASFYEGTASEGRMSGLLREEPPHKNYQPPHKN